MTILFSFIILLISCYKSFALGAAWQRSKLNEELAAKDTEYENLRAVGSEMAKNFDAEVNQLNRTIFEQREKIQQLEDASLYFKDVIKQMF